jgi:hypothetical protein
MTFTLVWNALECNFYENDTVIVLVEQALNADMSANDPRTNGPLRTSQYDGITWDLVDQRWNYPSAPFSNEEDAIAAWILVMEAPL